MVLGDWEAEEPSRPLFNAFFENQISPCGGFVSFDAVVQLKVAGQRTCGEKYIAAPRRTCGPHDKVTVNLNRSSREGLDLTECCGATAEVVNRDADAQGSNHLKFLNCRAARERHGFGHLHAERFGRERVFHESGVDGVRES